LTAFLFYQSTSSSFHIVDIKPQPIGVVYDVNQNLCSISLSGSEISYKSLESGNTYFTDTTGRIFPGSISSNIRETPFVMISDQNTVLISAYSKIGVAITSDTLLLSITT
jgi:hypothetical protein